MESPQEVSTVEKAAGAVVPAQCENRNQETVPRGLTLAGPGLGGDHTARPVLGVESHGRLGRWEMCRRETHRHRGPRPGLRFSLLALKVTAGAELGLSESPGPRPHLLRSAQCHPGPNRETAEWIPAPWFIGGLAPGNLCDVAKPASPRISRRWYECSPG